MARSGGADVLLVAPDRRLHHTLQAQRAVSEVQLVPLSLQELTTHEDAKQRSSSSLNML